MTAEKRFKAPSSVFILIFKDSKHGKEILLQKRKGTGYMDGYWDASVAGHSEKDESISTTALREAKEELGIEIKTKDLKFAAVSYNNFENNVYSYFYFVAVDYEGKPKIMEKEKCAELKWFNVNNLPAGIIPDREESIKKYLDGKIFCEFGW